MNIIEAIKSGKRFRRKGNLKWVHSFGCSEGAYCFSVEGLIADDWEVEEKEVVVTEEQLRQAWKKANADVELAIQQNWIGVTIASRPGLYEALKKELGL